MPASMQRPLQGVQFHSTAGPQHHRLRMECHGALGKTYRTPLRASPASAKKGCHYEPSCGLRVYSSSKIASCCETTPGDA